MVDIDSDALSFQAPTRPGLAISILRGDITQLDTDAIVNAANQRLLGGGGVDGAIHRAAGPELLRACRAIAELRAGVRCPVGEARVTPGFKLRARHVIHTVGPVYRGAERSASQLAAAHRSCLQLATELSLASIAFPAISCGVYGYPLEAAARIALETCVRTPHRITDVRFVLFDAAARSAWCRVARRMADLLRPAPEPGAR